MTTRVIAPGEGERFEMTDGVHIAKASARDDEGAFELFEIDAPKAPAAPPHRSPWSGVLYLLDGAIRVTVDGEIFDLTAGATVTVPARTPLTFEVTSDGARFLAITTGAGAGKFFADFARTVPVGRPIEEIMRPVLDVTERHGVSVAAPTG